jgi:hypothetical protein
MSDRPYTGEIKVGGLFLWEPTLPSARVEIIVVRIDAFENDERKIWSRGSERKMHMYFNKTVWNDERRFREAVVPSSLKFPLAPLQPWEEMNPHAKLEGPWPVGYGATDV